MNKQSSPVVTATPRHASFDMVSMWTLLGTLFLATLSYLPFVPVPLMITKVTLLALGTLISFVFFVLARLIKGNIIVPPLALLGILWLLPLAYLLSSFFSGTGLSRGVFGSNFEADTLGFVLLCALITSIVAVAFRRSAQYKLVFKIGIIVAAIVFLSEVVFFTLGLLSPTTNSAVSNLIGSFADLGMFSGMVVIISLLGLRFLALSRNLLRGIWLIIAAGLAILAIVNSTLTWSLVALVAFGLFVESALRRRVVTTDEDFGDLAGVEAMPVADVVIEKTHQSSQDALSISLITFIISLFFLLGGQTIGASLTGVFGANYLDVRPSLQSTFIVGSHGYASSPLFGTGPNTFGTEWLKFRDLSINDTIFWNVDFTTGIGFIPTSFITTGLVGALAWLLFIGFFLFSGIRALLFRTPEDQFVRFVSVASFFGGVYVLILSMFTVPSPVIISLGFLFIGLFVSSLRYSGERQEWGIVFGRNPRLGFVIVFFLTLSVLGAVVTSYTVAERYLSKLAYAQAVQALSVGDIEKASEFGAKSIFFSPSEEAYQLAAGIGMSQMRNIVAKTGLSANEAQQQFQQVLSDSIAAAKQATLINPSNYKNWMVLGNVYQIVVPLKIEGAYENAKQAYSQAKSLNPSSPSISFVLAQLEVAQGNNDEAEKNLIEAISAKHDYAEAIFLLSQIQVQEGKAKEALQTAEAAAYFAPSDPNVLFQVGILRSGTGDQAGALTALIKAVEINPQFANARFFIAVILAGQSKYAEATEQLRAVSDISPENAKAVAGYIQMLVAGKNPFPQQKDGALGVPASQVTDTSTSLKKTSGN